MAPDQSALYPASASPDAAQPLPLFYRNPVPLDPARHANASLKNFGLDFTQRANAVPVNVVELAKVCHVYPIVFSADETAYPVAILGLRDNENLFLDANGQWIDGVYIPSYIRRYPFILSTMLDRDDLVLCVDDPDETLAENGPERFFDDSGKPTRLARNAMEFCQTYNAAGRETGAFSQALKDAGVLTRHAVEIGLSGDRRFKFAGFRSVDPDKLAALDDATFLEWRQKGWLPYIYAHLLSAPQWQRLVALLNARTQGQQA